MGNCWKCKEKSGRKIILLLVGLDNAGKTVAAKTLAGENPDGSMPTVGFSIINLNYLNYEVCIYDLGGGQEIRGIWHRYFVDAHGVIFVIDASDYERFEEAKEVLGELLSHEKISGKPLLILANKQDNKEALDEIDLVEKLSLEDLVNEKQCPTLVESCSAKENQNNKIDPGIDKGYHWLLNYIVNIYDILNKRVENDIQKQKEIDDRIREEKIERLKMRAMNKVVENEAEIVPVKQMNGKAELVNNFVSPTHSVRSVSSVVDKTNESKPITAERPKSAVQLVKNHLEKSSRRSAFVVRTNKTAPLTLLSPKSAPVLKTRDEQEHDGNFRCTSQTGQILTVTELPNAIIDANGENIGDLFELNNFSTSRKLPPLKTKPVDDMSWINKPRNNVSVIQNSIDEIYKDIS